MRATSSAPSPFGNPRLYTGEIPDETRGVVVATLLAVAFLGERLGPGSTLGAALLLGAIVWLAAPAGRLET